MNKRWIGREVPVLISGPSAESELLWEARMEGQAPEIDGVCYIGDPGPSPLAPGQMRRMRITKAHDYDLVGDLVDEATDYAPVAANPFRILTGGHRPSVLPHP